MKIEIDNITEYQKLIIVKGLYDYQYIMNNWENVKSRFFGSRDKNVLLIEFIKQFTIYVSLLVMITGTMKQKNLSF